MNKYDLTLLVIILIVSFLGIFRQWQNNSHPKIANLYYESDKILSINLNNKLQKYKVSGAKGPILIEAGEGKIRVLEENSPIHLCSKQGFISKKNEQIICLPNKIVIELEDQEMDAIIS